MCQQSKQFWKEVNRVKGDSSPPLAFTIDKKTGQRVICKMWKGHYKSLLNMPKPTPLKYEVLKRLESCITPESPFRPSNIYSVIKALKNGKLWKRWAAK